MRIWHDKNTLSVEYVRGKCQRAVQPHINLSEISFFSVFGLRTNPKKGRRNSWYDAENDHNFPKIQADSFTEKN